MRRRELLTGVGLLMGGLVWKALPAKALGGVALIEGESVPHFDLPGSSRLQPERRRWELSDFKGKWLAIYFYPRDFTGGCTIEARGFQSLHQSFLDSDAEVIGVSADSIDDHESFCASEELNFPLLSDPDGVVSKAYGSWMAPYSLRHTFLIDPQGILRRRWVAVRPNGHAAEVLDALRDFQNNTPV